MLRRNLRKRSPACQAAASHNLRNIVNSGGVGLFEAKDIDDFKILRHNHNTLDGNIDLKIALDSPALLCLMHGRVLLHLMIL